MLRHLVGPFTNPETEHRFSGPFPDPPLLALSLASPSVLTSTLLRPTTPPPYSNHPSFSSLDPPISQCHTSSDLLRPFRLQGLPTSPDLPHLLVSAACCLG